MTRAQIKNEIRIAEQLEQLIDTHLEDVIHYVSTSHLKILQQQIAATLAVRLFVAKELGYSKIELFEDMV